MSITPCLNEGRRTLPRYDYKLAFTLRLKYYRKVMFGLGLGPGLVNGAKAVNVRLRLELRSRLGLHTYVYDK